MTTDRQSNVDLTKFDLTKDRYRETEAQALLDYLYLLHHNRQRDPGEAPDLVAMLENHGNLAIASVLNSIITSSEMTNRVNHELRHFYRDRLGREPSEEDNTGLRSLLAYYGSTLVTTWPRVMRN